MEPLKILTYPDEFLSEPTKPVEKYRRKDSEFN